MTQEFFRFPHTPHLAWLGNGVPRDDKVLSSEAASALLAVAVVVEEKLDGANLGFSLGESGKLLAQSRGQYLDTGHGGQFSRLPQWMTQHGEALLARLEPNCIAFGEWCAARHSLAYDHLPDWWLMFDLYDRQSRRFQSITSRNEFAQSAELETVAEIFRGRTTLHALERLLLDTPSRYRTGPIEGLMVRSENATGMRATAKLVHPAFTQSIEEHWRSRYIEWNRVDRSPTGTAALKAHA